MTNILYLQNHYRRETHQNSIMASLTHRLKIAQANNDVHLVGLLEQERQQVAPNVTAGVRSRASWWRTMTRHLANVFFGGSELQVSEIVDGHDRWWVASNPQTGEFVYADSEAELRLWIEEKYQGR